MFIIRLFEGGVEESVELGAAEFKRAKFEFEFGEDGQVESAGLLVADGQ